MGFNLFGATGIVCALAATYHYLMGEWHEPTGVSVALVAFALHYGLLFASTAIRENELVPNILLFFTAMSLIVAIRVGTEARSRAGFRIALAGLFTLAAY